MHFSLSGPQFVSLECGETTPHRHKGALFLAGREQSLLPWSIGIPWKRFPYVEIPLSLEKLIVLFSAIGLFCENNPCNRILTLKKITKKRNDEF